MENTDTGLRGLAEFVSAQNKIESFNVTRGDPTKASFIAVPEGMELNGIKRFLDEYLSVPERIKGLSRHSTVNSLISHIGDFKDEGTVIFANVDPKNPEIMAIYNYNMDSGTPRFGDHRAVLDCTLSDEWKTWTQNANETLSQHQFASMIEDNIGDIQQVPDLKDPKYSALKDISMTLAYAFAGQDEMLKLSRGIEIYENSKAKSIVSLNSGERTLEYMTEHKDAGGSKISVPGLFLISIPVFKDSVSYRLPVRLRYRLIDSVVKWSYDIYRDDKAFKLAYDEMCELVQHKTALPIYFGKPE